MTTFTKTTAAALGLALALPAAADELTYAYFDIAYYAQDTSLSGTQDVLGQTVDLDTSDGDGIRFRASLGLWHNLYGFADVGSTNIDDSAVVTNDQGTFPASDEFDLTTIRIGAGYAYPVTYTTHVIAEVSYDSADYDFGSFAGEDFDADDQGLGARLGVRALFARKFELGAYARYTDVGTVDLNTGKFDSDTLFGVQFAWTPIRAFSIIADYEAGDVDSWALGFRLGLLED